MQNIRSLREGLALAEKRRLEILNAPDALTVTGTRYYVSTEGSDDNDGLSPERPLRSIERLRTLTLQPGDGVLFRRGDTFRGAEIEGKSGVSYGAYGEGPKPRILPWRALHDPALWREEDAEHHIWRWLEPILDVGTLVFNEGEACARKLIPSYIGGRFVCREDAARPFSMAEEMREDLDLYWHFEEKLTRTPSRGEDFPVPDVNEGLGTLFLRCDRGNPARVFASIEAAVRRRGVRVTGDHVTVDNLSIRYAGLHGICGGGVCLRGLHVTNCELIWIGGTIQNYLGLDPNYPAGGRGTVTRFGNAVEIYGGCDDYVVSNCYIDQCYDAGVTHQVSTNGQRREMTNILYKDNVIDRCVYGIEYFLDLNAGDDGSCMKHVEITGNILLRSGEGWGEQRHNKDTPAHIKGWSYHNRAEDFSIRQNLFLTAGYRMLHLVARDEESLPRMEGNVYIQRRGGLLGQYGANGGSADREPPVLPFDGGAEAAVRTVFLDRGGAVAYAEETTI